MFQFTSFAFQPYIFRLEYLQSRWVSSFGDLWIKAYLPAPHSFSQAVTSFIACDRQGIHHIHLVTWSYNPEAFCPQSHKQPITYTLISLIMSVLENFNESMNAITTRLSTSTAISSRQLLLTERFVSFQIVIELTVWPSEEGSAVRKRSISQSLAYGVVNGGSGWSRTNDPRLIKTVL